MSEVFSAQQPNEETVGVSLIQHVVNSMDQANAHKKQAIDALELMKGWLVASLDRDYRFTTRLVQAIADNSQHVDLLDDDIAKIASTFGANGNGGDNAQLDNTQ